MHILTPPTIPGIYRCVIGDTTKHYIFAYWAGDRWLSADLVSEVHPAHIQHYELFAPTASPAAPDALEIGAEMQARIDEIKDRNRITREGLETWKRS